MAQRLYEWQNCAPWISLDGLTSPRDPCPLEQLDHCGQGSSLCGDDEEGVADRWQCNTDLPSIAVERTSTNNEACRCNRPF
jgi:hypothetical protein